jgi:hypothetical protein
MNYSFAIVALDLSGKEMLDTNGSTGITLGRILANSLVSQSKGDALKFYDWAKKMYKGEPVNLDRSDVKTLQEYINNDQSLTVLAKAQILEVLENGKE